MNFDWQHLIPEPQHASAHQALSSAFGTAPLTGMERVLGGASGALTYRIEVAGRFYLLRLETRRGPLRNPHQYACLKIACDAGIAPAAQYADDAAGAIVMDFVQQQPLASYPGGPQALAKALGELAAKLQATEPFPVLGDYRNILARGLAYLRTLFAPGLLDPHLEAFERIREAYPWDAGRHVSTHNDPNPRNVLFDGQRLWLIDWETSYRNDPFTDVAIFSENHAANPELEDLLLGAWLGREPSAANRARLRIMRQLTRLYYATLMGFFNRPATPIADLVAPTSTEFRDGIADGTIRTIDPQTPILFCKVLLASYLAECIAPDFDGALKAAKEG